MDYCTSMITILDKPLVCNLFRPTCIAPPQCRIVLLRPLEVHYNEMKPTDLCDGFETQS